MPDSAERYLHGIMSGHRRGLVAGTLRTLLRAAEPEYAAAMRLRNALFDSGLKKTHRLPVPVISVGNITAGGTGKTPVVRWLANRLRALGMKPAILLRGYKKTAYTRSDEQAMLQGYLGGDSNLPPVPVHANPDRVAGGKHVLEKHKDVNLLLLDDAYQHRRIARDFDLVLIDASNPFGYGHVHPRGLLREPLSGLKRADAFLLTRCDSATPDDLQNLSTLLRAHNPTAPTYRTTHTHTGLRSPNSALHLPPDLPLSALSDKRFYLFAGLANPTPLLDQLLHLPGRCVGHHWFPDHHRYTPADLIDMRQRARSAQADVLLVTEKDYVKLSGFDDPKDPIPLWRLEMEIRFEGQGEQGLLDLIQARLDKPFTA